MIAVAIIIVFRPQIGDLISGINKASIQVSEKGFGVALEESIKAEVVQLDDLRADIKKIVDMAATSRERAITLAWGLIEKKLRKIVAISHWNNGIYVSVRTNVAQLISLGVLAPNTLSDLKVVEDEHDRIFAHKEEGNKNVAEIALIASIQILRSLYSIALQEDIVEAADIKLCSDPQCKKQVAGVRGVMIRNYGKRIGTEDTVFPTTRTDYREGERVTWDFDMSKTWNALWYRDPKTGKIKKGFDSSADFVGGNADAL